MSAKSGKDGQHFPHKTGEVVLVKWRDGKIYFAKIKTIEWSKKRCVVIFDDKSQDLARFSWIHDVNETTSDIICVKCKQDSSDKGNEIVLCDQCGYGYHQKCHETKILQRALEDDSSWICYFCEQDMACPYVANADALTQSLADIDDHGNKPDKFKKKRKQSLKISTETSKKYCTGLLADSPTVEQSGEEEAIGEHYMEQSGPISAKPHKTQSRRKSKPYKVEICSSISKEYFVDDEEDDLGSETPTPSRSRKIKRKTPQGLESAGAATKKFCSDSPNMTESPSGVGIFSFDMPTEFHSNLHQLAMASQLVSQSPSGEVPNSVIKAIEHEQSKQDHHKSSSGINHENGINREKPKSLVLSIPRSPLISISGKQSTTTTPGSSLVRQSVLDSSTPSCITTTAITSVPPTTTTSVATTVSTTIAAAIHSPVIVSNRNSKTTSPLQTAIIAGSTTPAKRAIPGSPDSEESVFTYSNSTVNDNDVVVISQSKPTTTPAIVRVESGESDVVFTSSTNPVTSTETVPKAIARAPESLVILATSSDKAPTETTPSSTHPMVTTPMKVTQNGAFFECPPPVSMVTKPTSIQFIDKTNVRMLPKFMSPVTTPAVTMPTIADSSPVIVDNSMVRATPTPGTPATQPVYYVQISGGTPSQPVLVRPVRQPQAQSPIIKVVDGSALNRTGSPVLSRTQSGSSHINQQANRVDQPANHVNGNNPSDSTKDGRTMYFANQMKDVGTNISVKMGATYNMVSEYTLISKFEEAWNKLNELAAQWQQSKQTPVSKKPPVTKVAVQQSPTVHSSRDKVVMVAQQQPQQIVQQIPQQRIPQQQTLQHQRLTTPVQLVPISASHHVTTPIVHGDVVSVLPSPAHVISTPPHVISTPGHVISTPGHVISNPVVIPAVARTGSDNVAYYSVPPNASINPATRTIHPHSHKKKDEVYMVQVKPVAPVMPVTPVMSVRSGEKRTPQQCDVCSKKASFLCSGCQSAWYCGRTCQYNAWQEHSHRCNKRS